MNLLLDTNALLWWLGDSPRLGRDARDAISAPENQVFVSAASAWEIAIKVALGRLEAPSQVGTWLREALLANRFNPLPITISHAAAVELLPSHHADPFDRILIAQVTAENLTLVTGDDFLARYMVPLLRC